MFGPNKYQVPSTWQLISILGDNIFGPNIYISIPNELPNNLDFN